MLIEITPDPIGGYTASPVSESIRRKYAAHLRDFNVESDGSAYFQGDYELPQEILANRQWPHLCDGWTVRVRVDPWVFGHWLGWDAHNVEV